MSRVNRLRDRAHQLKLARQFFDQRGVIEVDCPAISPRASVDAHIDLISALYNHNEKRYLHSSPEFGMKRLISEGIGDIFQLSHVYRDGEYGVKHNPEFMMAEWYRMGFSLEQLIDETVEFIRLFIGDLSYSILTYREAFKKFTGLDYVNLSDAQLMKYIESSGISYYPNVLNEGKDALLNLILAAKIEPHLGQEEICVFAYYPSSQAALAKKRVQDDEEVAERFEVYYKGIELANGYHELTDPIEQRKRFIEANEMRIALGKEPLPIDDLFLKALEKGLPDCSGVAVGFDRLMMLRQKQDRLADVIPWEWPIA